MSRMRLVILFLLCTALPALAIRVHVPAEPTVFEGHIGPLDIYGYGKHTVFSWSGPGNRSSTIGVPVPFYALMTGLAAGVVLLGLLFYHRQRHACPR